MRYKNAFNCKKCPERNDEQGCPVWWEVVECNLQTQEERLVKACGFSLLPKYLTEVIKASNRPAAAVESCRNEIAQGFGNLVGLMTFAGGMIDGSKEPEKLNLPFSTD